jgi:hypothetical protein
VHLNHRIRCGNGYGFDSWCCVGDGGRMSAVDVVFFITLSIMIFMILTLGNIGRH